MLKKRKYRPIELPREDLSCAIIKMTPVVDLIKEANTNNKLTISEYFDIVYKICEYDDYAKLFVSQINVDSVRLLEKENFTEEQKLAMLYLLFNSSVKYRIRKKIANELKEEFPDEIKTIKKYSFSNRGLEMYIN